MERNCEWAYEAFFLKVGEPATDRSELDPTKKTISFDFKGTRFFANFEPSPMLQKRKARRIAKRLLRAKLFSEFFHLIRINALTGQQVMI